MFQKSISYFSVIVIAVGAVFFANSLILAWSPPTASPPSGNVPAPLNVGTASQYKSGALGIGGVFHGYSNGIFDGNVGIGVTNPNEKLDVDGYIKAKRMFDFDDTYYFVDPHGMTRINRVEAHKFVDLDDADFFVEPASVSKFQTIEISAIQGNYCPCGACWATRENTVREGNWVCGCNEWYDVNWYEMCTPEGWKQTSPRVPDCEGVCITP